MALGQKKDDMVMELDWMGLVAERTVFGLRVFILLDTVSGESPFLTNPILYKECLWHSTEWILAWIVIKVRSNALPIFSTASTIGFLRLSAEQSRLNATSLEYSILFGDAMTTRIRLLVCSRYVQPARWDSAVLFPSPVSYNQILPQRLAIHDKERSTLTRPRWTGSVSSFVLLKDIAQPGRMMMPGDRVPSRGRSVSAPTVIGYLERCARGCSGSGSVFDSRHSRSVALPVHAFTLELLLHIILVAVVGAQIASVRDRLALVIPS